MEIEANIDKNLINQTDLVSKAEKKDTILKAADKYNRNTLRHQINHTSTGTICRNPPRHSGRFK
jgi:hypothetical protein